MSSGALGKVYLVGAGPGDPKLLTLRAVEVLAECHVVLIDRLVNRDVLKHARRGAFVIDVGKRAGDHAMKQEDIGKLLVAYARQGQIVVRLKGGDPFVFGRGGEEALALARAQIPWEVVPGVSAGIAAAAYAGIPLTHRGVASRVSFRTARRADPAGDADGHDETTVFFMCGSTLADVARELISSGRTPSTPIAVVRSGTCADQEVFVGTLADALAGPFAIESPALAIVGDAVALHAKLRWFGARASRSLASMRRAPHRRGTPGARDASIAKNAAMPPR
jgi:uroporphyrin-III C-methyltransferase